MDCETGEENFIDSETGECLSRLQLNLETGEDESNYGTPNYYRKKIFKIPNNNTPYNVRKPNHSSDVSDIESGSIASALMYLLPTAFFFNPLIAVVLFIIEMSLHAWAHKKNKKLRDSTVYYQSPLHIIVSEFCAACREEVSSNKINKIQEKRSKLKGCGIECVRQIVT